MTIECGKILHYTYHIYTTYKGGSNWKVVFFCQSNPKLIINLKVTTTTKFRARSNSHEKKSVKGGSFTTPHSDPPYDGSFGGKTTIWWLFCTLFHSGTFKAIPIATDMPKTSQTKCKTCFGGSWPILDGLGKDTFKKGCFLRPPLNSIGKIILLLNLCAHFPRDLKSAYYNAMKYEIWNITMQWNAIVPNPI